MSPYRELQRAWDDAHAKFHALRSPVGAEIDVKDPYVEGLLAWGKINHQWQIMFCDIDGTWKAVNDCTAVVRVSTAHFVGALYNHLVRVRNGYDENINAAITALNQFSNPSE
jgi:hypothetical protein